MKSSRKAQLAADPGVLEPEPVCEFQGYESARTAGSVAVLPWRAESLAASTLGIRTVRSAADLGDERFGQCLVHLQKSRAATWSDLTAAWHLLKRMCCNFQKSARGRLGWVDQAPSYAATSNSLLMN